MSEHPFHDLANQARGYFLDNIVVPTNVELEPLSLHQAVRTVLQGSDISPEMSAWLLFDAIRLSAPLQRNDEKLELGGVELLPAYMEILVYSIEAYLLQRYEDVRKEDSDRFAW